MPQDWITLENDQSTNLIMKLTQLFLVLAASPFTFASLDDTSATRLQPNTPTCHDSVSPIDVSDCERAVLELEDTYPERSPRGSSWRLTHKQPSPAYPNVVHCPLIFPAGQEKGSCLLVIDYSPPSGQDSAPAYFDSITEWASQLDNNCAIQGKAGIYWHSASKYEPEYFVKLGPPETGDELRNGTSTDIQRPAALHEAMVD